MVEVSPRKTLMEALSAWSLLVLSPDRILGSPLSTITLLSLLMQLIPQLSSHTNSPVSAEHCNADRFYERKTRPPIGRAEVNSVSHSLQRDVSKLTCWSRSLLQPLRSRAAMLEWTDFGGDTHVSLP